MTPDVPIEDELRFYMKEHLKNLDAVMDKLSEGIIKLDEHFVEHDKRAAAFMAESCRQNEQIIGNQKVIFTQVLKYMVLPLIGVVVGYRLVMPS